MVLSEKKTDAILTLAAGLLLVTLAALSTGTGDDGDSVQHYLFSRWAFAHPENFFHHWAKPIFVMLSAPAAQFGFTGIKVFNALLLTFQIWLLLKIAAEFGMKNRWLLPVIALAAPMNLTHTLSGLTEPLFAVWLAGPMLLLLRGRPGWAYVLWSFLPLVRSEGLVVFCPLLIYMVLRGDWRWLPSLLVGHVVIGLVGWHWHYSPLWPITEIPYANLETGDYGQGPWLHFFWNMPVIIGSTLTVLLVTGLLDGFSRLILTKNWLREARGRDEAWLVFALFIAYFLAHSLFWALGIFNSYGLLRVFLAIMPCIALICLCGANRLFSTVFFWVKGRRGRLALMAALPVFLVWRTVCRLDWNWDFSPNSQQLAVAEAVKAIRADFPDPSKVVFYAEYPEVHRQLGLDYFDTKKSRRAEDFKSEALLPPNAVVIYDFWYMGQCHRLPLNMLAADPRLVERGAFEGTQPLDYDHKIRVFYADSTRFGGADVVYKNPLDTFATELSGRKCFKLDTKSPFSPGFTARAGDLRPGDDLVFSFELCQPDTADAAAASLVFQIASTAGETYAYRTRSLKDGLRTARGGWTSFRFLEKMPPAKSSADKVSAYVWDPQGMPIFLDNFEVRRRQATE